MTRADGQTARGSATRRAAPATTEWQIDRAPPAEAERVEGKETEMPIPEVKKIWMNGKLVDWADAQVHLLTHALHYGSGVFEGIRAYNTARGAAVFRLTDHLERLGRSAKMYYMELPYAVAEMAQATKDVIRANDLEHCYIRPIVFRGYGEMGLFSAGGADRRGDRRVAVGHLPRRRGRQARRAHQGSRRSRVSTPTR